MRVKGLPIVAGAVLLAFAASARAQEGFLDVFIAKVKPEKRAEFDAISKKVADLNRRNKGDTWIAADTFYGEWNTVYFISIRQNYAETQKGFDAFFGALSKPGGPAAGAKIFQDFNNTVVSTRTEIRRRRPDLSFNAPSDPAAMNKLIGDARFVRTFIVRVRPGRASQYENQIRMIKAAIEKSMPGVPSFVSQSVAGQQGTIYYISALRSSMGGFDGGPSLQQMMGDDAYARYQQAAAENTFGFETIILRYSPELSNPPEEVAAAAPDFWRPKPAMAPKPKPKAEAGKPSQ